MSGLAEMSLRSRMELIEETESNRDIPLVTYHHAPLAKRPETVKVKQKLPEGTPSLMVSNWMKASMNFQLCY